MLPELLVLLRVAGTLTGQLSDPHEPQQSLSVVARPLPSRSSSTAPSARSSKRHCWPSRRTCARLPPVDVDQLTYAEAGVALRVPEGTLTGGLHRARRPIRQRLDHAQLTPRRSR